MPARGDVRSRGEGRGWIACVFSVERVENARGCARLGDDRPNPHRASTSGAERRVDLECPAKEGRPWHVRGGGVEQAAPNTVHVLHGQDDRGERVAARGLCEGKGVLGHRDGCLRCPWSRFVFPIGGLAHGPGVRACARFGFMTRNAGRTRKTRKRSWSAADVAEPKPRKNV